LTVRSPTKRLLLCLLLVAMVSHVAIADWSIAPKSVSPQVKQVGGQVKQFLGKDARVITNKAGDKVFVSKDGLRRVRFDINRPNPHLNPHSHVEVKLNGKWIKSGPIYPKDVAPR
jgi:hypothetical protein